MPSGLQVLTFVAPAFAWRKANEVIAYNYLCLESDTGLQKLGDGSSRYNDLEYIAGGEGKEGEPNLLVWTPITFGPTEAPWDAVVWTEPIDTTGCTLLVAVSTFYWNRWAEPSFADSKGNIWNWTKKYPNVGGSAVWIYYAEDPIVGPEHRFTAIDGDCWSVAGYGGVSRRLALDKYNGCTVSDPGNDVLTNPVKPANNNSLLVSAVGLFDDSGMPGAYPDSDFKLIDTVGANPPLFDSYSGQAWAYKTQEGKAEENVLWTLDNFEGGYEDLAAILCSFRAEGTVDEDVDKYLDAIEMTDNRTCHAVEDLVYELKTETLWDQSWYGNTDCIYPMLGASPERCAINLKDPRNVDEANRITWHGNSTFSAGGVKSDGLTGYGDTHYIIAQRGLENKTHLAYYSRTEGASTDDQWEIGTADGNGIAGFAIRYAPNSFYGHLYNGFYPIGDVNTTGKGFFILTRTANNNLVAYRDGVQIATSAYADGMFNQMNEFPIYLNTINFYNDPVIPEYISIRECGFASIGGALESARAIAYSTIIANFMRRTQKQTTGWSPTNLTQAIAQYKASKMTGYAEDQKVDVLEDFIGSNDATPVGPLTPNDPRCTYRKGERDTGGSLDAAPHLYFNSFYTKMDTPITTAFGDFAVWGIFRLEQNPWAYYPLVDKHSSLGWWLGSGPVETRTIGGGILQATNASHFLPAPEGDWFSLFMQRQGATKTIRLNGQISSTSCSTALCDTTAMRIGAFNPGSGGLFTMKEFVVCNSFLSTVDMANMAMYVKKEYGLTF